MLHNLKHFKSRYVAEYKMDEFFIANIIFGKKKKGDSKKFHIVFGF